MAAEFLVIALVPVLFALAAGWDIASFTIPNFIPLVLLLSFVAFVFVAGFGLAATGSHLLAGLVGICIGFGLFALRYIGGGDAKFFAATLVWIGFRNILDYALLASLFGGGLTIVLVSLRALPLPASMAQQRWIAQLHNRSAGVPYGVALSLAAAIILPHTDVFRLAVAS